MALKLRFLDKIGGIYMLYCDEHNKDCNEVTSEECNNSCCDSCMFCIVYADEE